MRQIKNDLTHRKRVVIENIIFWQFSNPFISFDFQAKLMRVTASSALQISSRPFVEIRKSQLPKLEKKVFYC